MSANKNWSLLIQPFLLSHPWAIRLLEPWNIPLNPQPVAIANGPVPLLCQLCRTFILSVQKAYCDSWQLFRSTAYISLALLRTTWTRKAMLKMWHALQPHLIEIVLFPPMTYLTYRNISSVLKNDITFHCRLKLWTKCQIIELGMVTELEPSPLCGYYYLSNTTCFVSSFETISCLWLTWHFLSILTWSWTLSELLVSAFWVLGSQVCTAISREPWEHLWHIHFSREAIDLFKVTQPVNTRLHPYCFNSQSPSFPLLQATFHCQPRSSGYNYETVMNLKRWTKCNIQKPSPIWMEELLWTSFLCLTLHSPCQGYEGTVWLYKLIPWVIGVDYTVQFRKELCPGWKAKERKQHVWGRCLSLSCVDLQHLLCLRDLKPPPGWTFTYLWQYQLYSMQKADSVNVWLVQVHFTLQFVKSYSSSCSSPHWAYWGV